MEKKNNAVVSTRLACRYLPDEFILTYSITSTIFPIVVKPAHREKQRGDIYAIYRVYTYPTSLTSFPIVVKNSVQRKKKLRGDTYASMESVLTRRVYTYLFYNINDLSQCCKNQRTETKQRGDIYASGVSVLTRRVYTYLFYNINGLSNCCKNQRTEKNSAVISTHFSSPYLPDEFILTYSVTSTIFPSVVKTSAWRKKTTRWYLRVWRVGTYPMNLYLLIL